MEQEICEHLIKCAEKLARSEENYLNAKQELELLKAEHILKNDWENLLGKKRITVQEKEAFILLETEEKQRDVNQLKIVRDYCRRIYEIQMLKQQV